MPKRHSRFIALFLLGVLWLGGGWFHASASTLSLDGMLQGPLRLLPFLQVHYDPSGGERLQDIADADGATKAAFRTASPDDLAPGRIAGALWLKLDLHNDDSAIHALTFAASSPGLEYADLFIGENGAWNYARGGSSTPHAPQHTLDRNEGWRFNIMPGESIRLLFRAQSGGGIFLQPTLYPASLYDALVVSAAAWDGALIGGLAVFGLSILLLAGPARPRYYMWLGLLAFSAALCECIARGYAHEYLWPHAHGWGLRSGLATKALCVSLIAALGYSVVDREPVKQPPGRGTFLVLGCGAIASAAAAWFAPVLAVGLALLGVTVLLAASVIAAAVCRWHIARATASLLLLCAVLLLVHATTALTALGLVARPAALLTAALGAMPVAALLVVAGVLSLLARRPQGNWPRGNGPQATWPHAAAATGQPAPPFTDAPTRAQLDVLRQSALTGDTLRHAQAGDKDHLELLSYIGHDLRAPLATISGYLGLLRTGASPAQREHLEVIEHSVGYQFGLIDELLSYTRAGMHPFAMQRAPVPLPPLMKELTQYGVALCAQHRNTLRFEPATELPAVIVSDGRRLRQAVLNLVANAAKFTEDGTITLAVRADYEPGQSGAGGRCRLCITVQDDGVGIAPEHQSAIFRAYAQLRQKRGGFGLGLFIVERIVTGMQGTLTLESARGEGSRFVLCVPAVVSDATPVVMQPAVYQAVIAPPAPPADHKRLVRPPARACMELARMARAGEVTEISQWLAHARQAYPRCGDYLKEVATALQHIDLDTVLSLALVPEKGRPSRGKAARGSAADTPAQGRGRPRH